MAHFRSVSCIVAAGQDLESIKRVKYGFVHGKCPAPLQGVYDAVSSDLGKHRDICVGVVAANEYLIFAIKSDQVRVELTNFFKLGGTVECLYKIKPTSADVR